jgi:glucose-6-phosphate 1-dehydrogenase
VAEQPSDALVFFGATGDLSRRQIFPALTALFGRGQFDLPVIGVGRSPWSLDEFVTYARESVSGREDFDPAAFEKLARRLQYVEGDYRDPATFARIKSALGSAVYPLHYLAIPPAMFSVVVAGLAAVDLAKHARVVVEKPFGRDLASAQELNRILHASFHEHEIFRIDHYLGKEPVQNLVYFRFANTFLEPVWNRSAVTRVTITMAETLGVEGRGAFYEEVGAVRDVVQNHLLQVLALVAMEPPAANTAEAMQAARTAVLESIEPFSAENMVFGQYRGYRSEQGVSPTSTVETFASISLAIDNARWHGVPFVITAGKKLDRAMTEVAVDLAKPVTDRFEPHGQTPANRVVFRLSPDVFTAIDARAKVPGEDMRGETITLMARSSTETHAGHAHGAPLSPYDRLIGDALEGDRTLFTSLRSVEAAWRIVDPVVGKGLPVTEYLPGSAGV